MAQNRTRPRQIIIRMKDDEYALYEKQLEKSKLTGNSFGIKCLLDHPINVIENMPELIRQLKMIGNNLNQLTRAVNSGYTIPPEVESLQKGVDELWQLLRQLKGGQA